MILTLCGSISFKREMQVTGNKLESKGHTVLYPESISNPLSASNITLNELRLKYDLIKNTSTRYRRATQFPSSKMTKTG